MQRLFCLLPFVYLYVIRIQCDPGPANWDTVSGRFAQVDDAGLQQREIRLDEPAHTLSHDRNFHGAVDLAGAVADAVDVMQSQFFQLWRGSWPTAIDWTAAVLGTHLSAALTTLSANLHSKDHRGAQRAEASVQAGENEINKYFSQLMSFYFGQNAFSLRTQAYDDMLWVVLGWLESIKFIKSHSAYHHGFNLTTAAAASGEKLDLWYGSQFVPALAHRARVFYELAAHGWDTTLCGGGMIWNPYLKPYKNAITNELFIAASVEMYLHFPGDDNPSPFLTASEDMPPAKAHDPKFLTAALDAYEWLRASNMTNSQGLYVDGFHIKDDGRGNGTSNNTNCNVRNEMVYTYNQGVLLTGLRGLWESTGLRAFLDDGHALIRSVIAATGWSDAPTTVVPDGLWAGLGQDGILEELCDPFATCSQDGQTFKGIFFHHLTNFCAPLQLVIYGTQHESNEALRQFHSDRCSSYRAWVSHNARAAYATKDAHGKFGMWWGRRHIRSSDGEPLQPAYPLGAIDYRNPDIPAAMTCAILDVQHADESHSACDEGSLAGDLNDRGRGRTVETQSGGLSVLRAAWHFQQLARQ